MAKTDDPNVQLVERQLMLVHEMQRLLSKPLTKEQVGLLKKLCDAYDNTLQPEHQKNHALSGDQRLQQQVSKGKVSDEDKPKPKGP